MNNFQRKSLLLTLGLMGLQGVTAQVDFDTYFYDKAMRMDFYHCGNATQEIYFFDELKEEPYYAGSLTALTDTFGYGNQRFQLVDKESGKIIYSYDYCTLFNEWQTTDEAQTTPKGMPESALFPFPKKDVIAEIYSRDKHLGFIKKFEHEIKANNYFVRGFSKLYEGFDVQVNGNPHHCVDIVLIPEGYGVEDGDLFEKDCHYFANELLRYEPFASNRHRINVRGVWAPSREEGVSIPKEHQWFNTVVKANYYTFDSERYQMTEDFQAVRDVAGHVPYDFVYILTNSDKYGGGGIYNFYGLGAAHNLKNSGKVHVHEFGHQFVGLGDEYVEEANTMSEMYPFDVEPWEANLTTLVDFDRKAWSKMLKKDTPQPTPLDERAHYPIGLYEGGGYLGKGIYRPTPDCLMRTLDFEFCPVCKKAIEDNIDYLCR